MATKTKKRKIKERIEWIIIVLFTIIILMTFMQIKLMGTDDAKLLIILEVITIIMLVIFVKFWKRVKKQEEELIEKNNIIVLLLCNKKDVFWTLILMAVIPFIAYINIRDSAITLFELIVAIGLGYTIIDEVAYYISSYFIKKLKF